MELQESKMVSLQNQVETDVSKLHDSNSPYVLLENFCSLKSQPFQGINSTSSNLPGPETKQPNERKRYSEEKG